MPDARRSPRRPRARAATLEPLRAIPYRDDDAAPPAVVHRTLVPAPRVAPSPGAAEPDPRLWPRTQSEVVRLSARLLRDHDGAVARLTRAHDCRDDGTCSGHPGQRVLYPCHSAQVAAEVMRQRLELPADRRAVD